MKIDSLIDTENKLVISRGEADGRGEIGDGD